MRGPRTALALLTATLMGTGCEPEPEPDDDSAALRSARAVSHSNQTMDGTPRLAHLGALFAIPPLAPTDPEALRRASVQAVHTRLALTFQVIGCNAQLETDGDRTIDLSLQGCQLLIWTFDADIEVEASVETPSCDAEPCPVAVAWDLDIAELSSSILGSARSSMSGPATLRSPLDPSEPMRWETFPGFMVENRLGLRFESVSSASWRVDELDCVELDMGARLSLETRVDELDEAIGDVVVSARGVRRCPGQCEETGEVQLTFGAGQVVRWSHDGTDTITVHTPREQTFDVQLPCAEPTEEATDG